MTGRTDSLAVIVAAHHRPEQLATLLRVLKHPRVRFYLHLDRRAPLRQFQIELAAAGIDDVVWLRRRRTSWGAIDIVDVELDGISRAVADGCGYVMLISGEDFPLKPASELLDFVDANHARSYIESTPIPQLGWRFEGRERTDFYSHRFAGRMVTCIPAGEDASSLGRKEAAINWALRARWMFKPPRRFPDYLRPFGGSHWLNLSRDAASFVVDFVRDRPDYRRYHEHTVCADEIFIHSILMGSGFSERHEVVNRDLRFLVWDEAWLHPIALTMQHREEMLASSAVFARKIVKEHDPELYTEMLAVATQSSQIAPD